MEKEWRLCWEFGRGMRMDFLGRWAVGIQRKWILVERVRKNEEMVTCYEAGSWDGDGDGDGEG